MVPDPVFAIATPLMSFPVHSRVREKHKAREATRQKQRPILRFNRTTGSQSAIPWENTGYNPPQILVLVAAPERGNTCRNAQATAGAPGCENTRPLAAPLGQNTSPQLPVQAPGHSKKRTMRVCINAARFPALAEPGEKTRVRFVPVLQSRPLPTRGKHSLTLQAEMAHDRGLLHEQKVGSEQNDPQAAPQNVFSKKATV